MVKLPKSFVELYSMVNRVKGRDSRSDDTDDDGGFETAICLLTGAVMRSGTIRRMKQVRSLSFLSSIHPCLSHVLILLPSLVFSLSKRIALLAHVHCMQGRLDLGLAFFFSSKSALSC